MENPLAAVRIQLTKQFGAGVLRAPEPVQAHSTGLLALDAATGIGGLPKGRFVEVYGPESSGKTTLMLQAIAACQCGGGTAAYIDAEHALDLSYARDLGVDVSRLLVSQPDSGPQALEVVDALARSGAVDLIVVDSTAALVTKVELECDMGDSFADVAEKLMSQALRKLTAVCGRSGCTVVFISQLRPKYGVTFGSPEESTGENALRYYASMRIDMRRTGNVPGTTGEPAVGSAFPPDLGSRVRIKVVKNKCAPPFGACEVETRHGRGFINN